MIDLRFGIWLFIAVTICSCKKMITVDSPKNQLTTDKVFADSTSVTAVLLTSYSNFEKRFDPNYSTYVGLYTDELIYTGTDVTQNEFVNSRITVGNNNNQNCWSHLYSIIYQCNSILIQFQINSSLSKSAITQLSAEARFLRAMAYFYLVNIYGDVPLLLQTDVSINAHASRNAQGLVYDQIIKDLRTAENDLPVAYIGNGKVRANKFAASAMLARVFLYRNNWALAEKQADGVIGSNQYTPLEAVADVFKANSKEAIFQLWNQNGYTTNSPGTVPSSPTSIPEYLLSMDLYNSFETGDLRKGNWIGTINTGNNKYYYSSKYKNRSSNVNNAEYLMVLRISEQYLIRAEARAMLGNTKGAVDDVNVLRDRAGLKLLPNTIDQEECLSAIMKERRSEFFTENGHRFFDLKRVGKIDAVMSVYKKTWRTGISLVWPIPQDEITYNRNLVQNSGY